MTKWNNPKTKILIFDNQFLKKEREKYKSDLIKMIEKI